jgi:hypothetical protein
MAAIDFPNSPTVGQALTVGGKTWVWDGVTWNAKTTLTRAVSDTAPTSPVTGDEWFNSATGRLYTYYDSYWVEIGASVAGATGPAGATPTAGKIIAMSIVFGG